MEAVNFIALCVAIVVVLGIGVGVMTWAYVGKGSISLLFQEPISSLPELTATEAGNKAAVYFQQGIESYKSANYRQAVEQFNQAIQLVSSLAEAYHNRGLAFANLRSDGDAVADLLKASELYQEQGKGEGIAIIKQNLKALKQRKIERENRNKK